MHEEKALRLNRKRIRGQHRCYERRTVDASTKWMHAASAGAAVIILTSKCRNGLRDQREAALHGSQMGEEPSLLRWSAIQRSGNDYTEFIGRKLVVFQYVRIYY